MSYFGGRRREGERKEEGELDGERDESEMQI
jgi:hypothetical protein